MFNARQRLSLNLVSGRGYSHTVEGKGPVGEDEGEKKSWQCGGLCATQWGNGALASVGHCHCPVVSPPCYTGSVFWEHWWSGCRISTDWDRLSCWFLFTMAVLDNHSWQYAQAGKTLIRLSGRVTSPCFSSQINYLYLYLVHQIQNVYMPVLIEI